MTLYGVEGPISHTVMCRPKGKVFAPTGIDLAYFGLHSAMAYEGTTGVYQQDVSGVNYSEIPPYSHLVITVTFFFFFWGGGGGGASGKMAIHFLVKKPS